MARTLNNIDPRYIRGALIRSQQKEILDRNEAILSHPYTESNSTEAQGNVDRTDYTYVPNRNKYALNSNDDESFITKAARAIVTPEAYLKYYGNQTYLMLVEKIAQGFASSSLSKIDDINQELQDASSIRDYNNLKAKLNLDTQYLDLIKKNGLTIDLLNNDSYNKTSQEIQDILGKIKDYDRYFTGEGRTHPLIAKLMYDLNKADVLDKIGVMSSGLTNGTVQSNKGEDSGLLGKALGTILYPIQVAGNALKMGYLKLFEGDNKVSTDAILNASDGDLLIKHTYKGYQNYSPQEIINNKNLTELNLKPYDDENNRLLKEEQLNFKARQDFYKTGNFHINDDTSIKFYSPLSITNEFRQWQSDNNTDITKPLAIIPELGSSIGMMGGMIKSVGTNIALEWLAKELPSWVIGSKVASAYKDLEFAKKLGDAAKIESALQKIKSIDKLETGVQMGQTALRSLDIASTLYFTKQSRLLETALEKMDALGTRSVKLAAERGADYDKVKTAISNYANSIGIDPSSMSESELFQFGIANNVHTGDPAFESVKQESRKGLQKLVNDNNSLAYSDYLETLPFLNYGGSIFKSFGNKASQLGESALRMGLPETQAGKTAEAIYRTRNMSNKLLDNNFDYALPSILAAFDSKISKVGEKFMKKDAPMLALFAKRTGSYLSENASKALEVMATEGIEEGVQNLLLTRYQRGEYDNYRSGHNLFTLPEVVEDLDLSGLAIEDLIGVRTSDPDSGDIDHRKAMIVGALSGLIFSKTLGAMGNFRTGDESTLRGYISQLKNDKVASKIIGNNQGAILDDEHLKLFIDAFHKKGVDNIKLAKSLNDLKEYISDDSMVDKNYIDGDIKLMNSAYQLYADKEFENTLKELGVHKNSEDYNNIVRIGARRLVDYDTTRELANLNSKDIDNLINNRWGIIENILDPNVDDELKLKLKTDNPKLAIIAQLLNDRYEEYRQQRKDDVELKKQDLLSAKVNRSKEELLNDLKIKDYLDSKYNGILVYQDYFKNGQVQYDKLYDKFLGGLNLKDRMSEFLNIYKDELDDIEKGGLDKKEFARRNYSGINKYIRKQRVENMLGFVKDQKQFLSLIRKETGLDLNLLDIGNIYNSVNDIYNNITDEEKEIYSEVNKLRILNGEKEIGLESVMNGIEGASDDEELSRLYDKFILNSATAKNQETYAKAYYTLKLNPTLLKLRFVGSEENENSSIFDNDEKNYNRKVDEINSTDELSSNSSVNEHDLNKIKKASAVHMIMEDLKASKHRRKIAHAEQEEDMPFNNDDIDNIGKDKGATERAELVTGQSVETNVVEEKPSAKDEVKDNVIDKEIKLATLLVLKDLGKNTERELLRDKMVEKVKKEREKNPKTPAEAQPQKEIKPKEESTNDTVEQLPQVKHDHYTTINEAEQTAKDKGIVNPDTENTWNKIPEDLKIALMNGETLELVMSGSNGNLKLNVNINDTETLISTFKNWNKRLKSKSSELNIRRTNPGINQVAVEPLVIKLDPEIESTKQTISDISNGFSGNSDTIISKIDYEQDNSGKYNFKINDWADRVSSFKDGLVLAYYETKEHTKHYLRVNVTINSDGSKNITIQDVSFENGDVYQHQNLSNAQFQQPTGTKGENGETDTHSNDVIIYLDGPDTTPQAKIGDTTVPLALLTPIEEPENGALLPDTNVVTDPLHDYDTTPKDEVIIPDQSVLEQEKNAITENQAAILNVDDVEKGKDDLFSMMDVESLTKFTIDDNGDMYYEGVLVPEQYKKQIELLIYIENMFSDTTSGLQEFLDKKGERGIKNVNTSEDAYDFVSSTFFYQPDAETPMLLGVNKQPLKLPFDLHSGKELSSKLVQDGWFAKCKKYYVVSEEEGASGKNQTKDNLTVSLIIEDTDGKACYAASLRQLGVTYSKDGFVNDHEQKLRDQLIQKDLAPENKGDAYNAAYKDAKNRAILAWYNNGFAKDFTGAASFANANTAYQNYLNSLESGDRLKAERDMDYKARMRLTVDRIENGLLKLPLTAELIQYQIDKLRLARNAILDAYFTLADIKDGKYILPQEARTHVLPENVEISNGRILNTDHIYRKIDDGDSNEIQQKISSGEIVIGYGHGIFGTKERRNTISNVNGGDPLDGTGLSGKIYWYAKSPNGSTVPIMLLELKFNNQYTKTGNKKFISKPSDIELCIDPSTKLIKGESKSKLSIAEALLYMVMKQYNGILHGVDDDIASIITRMFVNNGEKTLVPDDKRNIFKGLFVAKQLSFKAVNGVPTLTIGVLDKDGKGYHTENYTDKLIFNPDDDTVRRNIVFAIATQMHINTYVKDMSSSLNSGDFYRASRAILRMIGDKDSVSIGGVPELTFNKNDFMNEDGTRKNVSWLSWMLSTGRLTTDTNKDVFYAPFVFANGVQQTAADSAISRIANANPESVKTIGGNTVIDATKIENVDDKEKLDRLQTGTSFNDSSRMAEFEKETGIELLNGKSTKEDILNKWGNSRFHKKMGQLVEMFITKAATIEEVMSKLEQMRKLYSDENGIKFSDSLDIDSIKENNPLTYKNPSSNVVKVYIYKLKSDDISVDGTYTSLVKIEGPNSVYPNSVTGVFSKIKGHSKLDEQEARKFLHDTLGINQYQIVVTDALLKSCSNERVFGLTNVCMDVIKNELFGYILLDRENGGGVQYHEAWHYVNLLMHNKLQREAIYDSYVRTHTRLKNQSYGEIEEAMAEDFKRYMESHNSRGILGQVKKLFNDIYDFVKAGFKKQEYRQIYKSIKNKEYASKLLDKESLDAFNKRYSEGVTSKIYVPGIPKSTFDNMPNIASSLDFYTVCDAVINHIMEVFNPQTIQNLRDMSNKSWKYILDEIENFADNQDNIYLSDMIMDIRNNPQAFKFLLIQEFNKYGIKAKIRKVAQLVGDRSTQEAEDAELDIALLMEDNPDINYDKVELKESKLNNATFSTKMFVSRIPMYQQIVVNGERYFVNKVDVFGNAQYWDPSVAMNILFNRLHDCDSYAGKNIKTGEYSETSILGVVNKLAKINPFFYSFKCLLSKILNDVQLISQLSGTLICTKKEIAQIGIMDPFEKSSGLYGTSDLIQQASEYSGYTKVGIADIDRIWQIKSDNRFRVMRMIPRQWSKELVLSNIIKDGKISQQYLDSLVSTLNEIKGISSKFSSKKIYSEKDYQSALYGENGLINKVISLANMMGIGIDQSVIDSYVANDYYEKSLVSASIDNISNSYIFEAVKSIVTGAGKRKGNLNYFISIIKNTKKISEKENTKVTLFITLNKKDKPLDELYNRFDDDAIISKLALAYDNIYPGSREFSVTSVKNEPLYPISSNNLESADTRELNGDDKTEIVKKQKSSYSRHSLLLDASLSLNHASSQEDKIKLVQYTGMKDENNSRTGSYYSEVTALEDYLGKMAITEDDGIISPTMADKKEYNYLKSNLIKLSHDLIICTPDNNSLKKIFVEEYIKSRQDKGLVDDNGTPLSDKERVSLEYDAKHWYDDLNASENLEDKDYYDYIYSRAVLESRLANEKNYLRFSDATLDRFCDYFSDELDSLIDYYNEKNVLFIINNPNRRIENYDGDVENNKLLFGGNAGIFRYFYDILNYKSDDGVTYNMNLRILMLYELLKKIVSENGVSKLSNDITDAFGKIGISAIRDKEGKLDGFELIRKYLSDMKTYFTDNLDALKDAINKKLIDNTYADLLALSGKDPQTAPIKCVYFDNVSNLYRPSAIPSQFLLKYVDMLNTIGIGSGADAYGDDAVAANALFSLVGSHMVNTITSIIEVEKAFTGDPALYQYRTIRGEYGKTALKASYKIPGTDITTKAVEYNLDNIGDKFSDKIKRLGSILSPGLEIRTTFTEKERGYDPTLASINYTNLNIEDYKTKSSVIDEISDKFRTLLFVDYIEKVQPKWFDDYVGKLNESSKNHTVTFLDVIDILYSDYNNVKKLIGNLSDNDQFEIETVLDQQLSAYSKMNVSDALVVIRPALYRRIRIGLGEWSMEETDGYSDEKAYNIIENDPDWMKDPAKAAIVRKLQLYPLKMSYQSNFNESRPNCSVNRAIYNKAAFFPLFKFVSCTDNAERLYNRMNRKGLEIDMVSFKSAVKVGAVKKSINPVVNGKFSDDFELDSDQHVDYTTDTVLPSSEDNAGKLPITVQKLTNLRMLLNTRAHDATMRAIGTLMFKIAFSNIIDDAKYGTGKSGRSQRLGGQIKHDIMACIKAMTQFGAQLIYDKFYSRIEHDGNVEYVVNQKAVKDFVQLVAKNNGLGPAAEDILNNNAVVASLVSRKVFENSASSVVNGLVVKINTNGGTAIQQSMFGFQQYDLSVVGEYAQKYHRFNDGKPLKWSGKEGSMQVMLSMNFFRNVIPSEFQGTYDQMRNWLVENNIIGDNSKPFGIGYRIPTQGMSSMFTFLVADVLPFLSGDLIIVPQEFTAQTGSDFDVDKLFLATLSYKNGKVEDFKDTHEDASYKDRIDGMINDENVLENGIGAISNRLLLNYMDIISDPRNFSNSRRPLDFVTDVLKHDVLPYLDKGMTQYLPGFKELSPSFQSLRKLEFMSGKSGILPFALNVPNLALTQYEHLTMDYSKDLAVYQLGKLDLIKGLDDIYISDWLSAMVNAHVDVAKDPYVFILNVNKFTYNHCNFLLRAGKGVTTFTFLAQPIIKRYAAAVNNSNGIYGNNLTGIVKHTMSVSKNKEIIATKIKNEFLQELQQLYYDNEDLLTDEEKNDVVLTVSAFKAEQENVDSSTVVNVFNKQKAIDAITGYNSDDPIEKMKSILFQLWCLYAFKKLDTPALRLLDLVSASLIDTEKFGNTIAQHINFRNNINVLKATAKWWKIDGFDDTKGINAISKYFSDLFLFDKFDKSTKLARGILSRLTYTASNIFDKLFKIIAQLQYGKIDSVDNIKYPGLYNKIYGSDKVDTFATAIDNVLRFKAFFGFSKFDVNKQDNFIDYTMGGDMTAVSNKFKQLSIGDEKHLPLFLRIYNAIEYIKKHSEEYKKYGLCDKNGNITNDFLLYLSPLAKTKDNPYGKLLLKQSLMNISDKSESVLISSFNDLLENDNENIRNLAKDIAFYSYYSNYDNNDPNSFFHLVPSLYRAQYDKAIKSGLNCSDSNFLSCVIGDGYSDKTSLLDLFSQSDGFAREVIDIISRNYWYYDDIVTPYKPLSKKSANVSQNYGEVDREPQLINGKLFSGLIITSNANDRPYIKVTKGDVTVLYKNVGYILKLKMSKKETKFITTHSVYIAVPKAGIRYKGNNQLELYANYSVQSIFEENKIPLAWSPSRLLAQVDDVIAKTVNENGTDKSGSTILFVNELIEIPSVYSDDNESMYTKNKKVTYLKNDNNSVAIVNRKNSESYASENSNIIIDINTDLHKLDPNKSYYNRTVVYNKGYVAEVNKLLENASTPPLIYFSGNFDNETITNAERLKYTNMLTHWITEKYRQSDLDMTDDQIDQKVSDYMSKYNVDKFIKIAKGVDIIFGVLNDINTQMGLNSSVDHSMPNKFAKAICTGLNDFSESVAIASSIINSTGQTNLVMLDSSLITDKNKENLDAFINDINRIRDIIGESSESIVSDLDTDQGGLLVMREITKEQPKIQEIPTTETENPENIVKNNKINLPNSQFYTGLITKDDDAVFVFGSNAASYNGNPDKGTGGAALAALEQGRLEQHENMANTFSKNGRSYGIQTVTRPGARNSLSREDIIQNIKHFYQVALEHPDEVFKIAYTNTGSKVSLNGYSGDQMIDMFLSAGNIPSNVLFSTEWKNTGKFTETEHAEQTNKKPSLGGLRGAYSESAESLINTNAKELEYDISIESDKDKSNKNQEC